MSEVGRDAEEGNLLVSVINDVIKLLIWVRNYVTNGQQGPHRWWEAVGFVNKRWQAKYLLQALYIIYYIYQKKYFLISQQKQYYVVGAEKNRLDEIETALLSTHNKCFKRMDKSI